MAVTIPSSAPKFSPQGFGINLWLGHEQLVIGSTTIPGTVVSRVQKFHCAIEARGSDGGVTDFGLVLLVDGRVVPVQMPPFEPDDEGIIEFEFELDGSSLTPGGHDVVLAATRSTLAGVAGIRLTWFADAVSFPMPASEPLKEVMWDRGSTLSLADGTVAVAQVPVVRPQDGVFNLVAHVQRRIAACPSERQTSRLFALTNDAKVVPIAGRDSIDLVYRGDSTARYQFELTAPTDARRIDVIQVDSFDRALFDPDGRPSAWFSPVVAEFGSLQW